MQSIALAGNARLKEQLLRQEQGRGLSHAYLISGPGGSGRHQLARRLAAAMVCAAPAEHRPCGRCAPCKKVFGGVHPDVSVISGPGATPMCGPTRASGRSMCWRGPTG